LLTRPKTSPFEGPAQLPVIPEAAADVAPIGIGHRRVEGDASIFWDNASRALPDGAPYCVFQYTLDGRGEFSDAGRRFDLPPGTAFLTAIPSPTQYSLALGRTWQWVWLGFRGALAHRLVERINAAAGRVLALEPKARAIRTLFDLLDAATTGSLTSGWDASARTYRILMDLAGRTLEADPPSDPVARALALMVDDLDNPQLDLARLADEAGLSRYHFLRRFKKETGQTPAACLREKRLDRAMELLTLSDLPVKRVAAMCGFAGSAHFCAAFAKRFGHSPGAIRRR
jgi:AraC-like DNA-binding protein